MSQRLALRRRAVAEIQEAHDWYEARGRGLGQEFLDEIDQVLAVLEEYPLRFPLVHRDVRRALTRRFPYAIWFRIRGEQVVVLTVLHQARDPARWPR
jgi:plasmid stabilization system protein ParE